MGTTRRTDIRQVIMDILNQTQGIRDVYGRIILDAVGSILSYGRNGSTMQLGTG